MPGGKRPGAGRKKGSKNPETLEKERVLTELRQRIMRVADLIFDSQLSTALGQQFLYKIEKTLVIGPKGGKKWIPSKPKLVTTQWEIEAWLEGQIKNGDMHDDHDPGATYYYLTTKEPNTQAIDSMYDRAFGRPRQEFDVTSGGEKVQGFQMIAPPNDRSDKANN